jgi:hypothetical protein
MASANFTNITDHLARARVNFGTATFKAALVTSVPSEANLDAWDFLDDLNTGAIEVAATGGYATGGFAVTAAVGAVDTTNNRTPVTYTCASPTYESSTITARGAVIYADTTVAGTSPLLHFVDFGESKSSENGNFTVTFDTPFYINRGTV